MPRRLAITMFIDACGHEVVRQRPWFLEQLPHRQRVESIFGYSSACVPAILSGKPPNENGHWSAFFHSPATSPFRPLAHMARLPSWLFDRGRVRRYLSLGLARAYRYTGYFQIYNVPFGALPLFDYAEKRDIFLPGGINEAPSIFDALADRRIPYHVSNWRRTEEENISELERAIASRSIDFGFLYTASLDGLMHETTRESPEVDRKLEWYQEKIERLLRLARSSYDEVSFAMISDHGMATVRREVDLAPAIEKTGLRYGQDYVALYDSTMMRFWFLAGDSRERIHDALPDAEHGRWISEAEHRRFGTYWADGRFGDEVYALEPGVLLCPSHMGRTPLAGMHGYRPDHPDSDALLISSFEPRDRIERITDFNGLMMSQANWAHSRGAESTSPRST